MKEFCEECSAYLHCCLNCRFHDPSVHNECAIPTTDWVGDKEGANFCDEFVFIDVGDASSAEDGSSQARRALEDVLGDSDAPSDSDRMKRFKGLFGE